MLGPVKKCWHKSASFRRTLYNQLKIQSLFCLTAAQCSVPPVRVIAVMCKLIKLNKVKHSFLVHGFYVAPCIVTLGLIVCLASAAFLGGPIPAWAIEDPGKKIETIGLSPRLGDKIDLSLPFTTAEGQSVLLRDLVSEKRPSIFVPVYYRCPRLCSLLLSGFVDLLKVLPLKVSDDFDVVVFSFNPLETPEEALAVKVRYADMAALTLEQRSRFHFLVGSEQSVAALTSQLGFKYLPDGVDFAHSAGLILSTPSGSIAQYFTGIEFAAFDVRLALVEASQGKIGSALDHVMLYCFRFDPTKGKYTWVMTGALRVGGALTLALLGGLIGALVWRERRKARRLASTIS